MFIIKITHSRFFNRPECDIRANNRGGSGFKLSFYVAIEHCLYSFKRRIIRRNMADDNEALVFDVFTFSLTPSVALRCFWTALQCKYFDSSLPIMRRIVLLENRNGFHVGCGTVKRFADIFSKDFKITHVVPPNCCNSNG